MDPQAVFCPNEACTARGKIGEGNISVHGLTERRYKCQVCDTTFAETKGKVIYRLRTAKETLILVVTLPAHGCPVQAIVMAFGVDEPRYKVGRAGRANTASKCTSIWWSSRGTWDRCRPMKSE